MDFTEADKILKDEVKTPSGGLFSLGWYLHWDKSDDFATLDGEFTADELEAIACWMRHKK